MKYEMADPGKKKKKKETFNTGGIDLSNDLVGLGY